MSTIIFHQLVWMYSHSCLFLDFIAHVFKWYNHPDHLVDFFNRIIISSIKRLIIAAKKHQMEIKYFNVTNRVKTQETRMAMPIICILLTLETNVETTVGIK